MAKPDETKYTTVLLSDGSTLRCRIGRPKVRRGLVHVVGIHGTKIIFPLSSLLRMETPA